MVIQKIREILFKILILLMFCSFVIALLGEAFAPNGWVGLWALIHILSIILAIYVYDPRIYYRRAVPILVCIAAVMYKIFKPVLQHNRTFKKCYKIKQMSGTFSDCYCDVQNVYDQYSHYNEERA